MASVSAIIRGLVGRNTIMTYASMRTMARTCLRNKSGVMGVRGPRRATLAREIGRIAVNPATKATIQQWTREAYTLNKQAPLKISQYIRTRLFHTTRIRRSPVNMNPNLPPSTRSPNENLTLGQRMRKLSREYGWSALGVYLALTALDFPFCYLLVRYLGAERIGEWEHIVVSSIVRFIPEPVKKKWQEWRALVKQSGQETTDSEAVTDHVEVTGWGVEEAQERNKKDASLATQLALAYAIHKSFIFIRVPLTAAITPKVVRTLRGWGWDVGKRTSKEAKALKRGLGKPTPK